MYDGEADRKLYCGNLCEKVTEEILHELFLQAGPIEKVQMPLDRYGKSTGYAFVIFKHACSVPYAIELFEDTSLFGYFLKLNVPKHHRTQSMPIRLGQNQRDQDNGHSSQVDFDSLLKMSTNMLGGRGPPTGMGPPMAVGYPTTHLQKRHSMGRGAPPPVRSEPPPPGEEDPSIDQPWNEQKDMNQDRLSQSSLQGNWSARNSSHMLPDDSKNFGHNSRRDHDRRKNRDWDNSDQRRGYQQGYNQGGYDRSGYNQGGYDRSGYDQGGYDRSGYDQGGYGRSGYGQGAYDQGGYNRSGNRNFGNHQGHRNDRDNDGGYRSRSSDPQNRRGRY